MRHLAESCLKEGLTDSARPTKEGDGNQLYNKGNGDMSELAVVAERNDRIAAVTTHPPGVVPSRSLSSATVAFKAGQMPNVQRTMDVAVALLALLFLLPLLLIVACAVKATSRGPVVFRHQRVGRGGKAFHCYKFRSMVIDAEQRLNNILLNDPVARAEWAFDQKLKKDPRVTPIGRFLRASSLDELPQFFNVLRGDMSMVGPRPIVAAEIVRYGRRIEQYMAVRPGITGLWQVSGRNHVSYRRRVAMDYLYSRKQSVSFDLRIMVATVPMVLLAKGSY